MRFLVSAVLLGGCAAASSPDPAPPLRILSYNVRVGTAKDGRNHWDQRRELCAARAVAARPDVAGLQEALGFQNDYLCSALGEYGRIGVGRDDGREKGEHATILYRKDRLEPAVSGTFWLSETPDVTGSKSWDSMYPRIATWALFRDRRSGGREFLFVNAHFDHRGVRARLEAARIVRAFVERHGVPAIVTGDFNVGPDSEPYRALVGEGLKDVWPVLHPERVQGTFHGFTGTATSPRIDWILCTPHFEPKEAGIDDFQDGGRYPSDHFPVWAVLTWR